MSKENAHPDFKGNITEQLAVYRDLQHHGYNPPEFDINRYLFPATFESETGDEKLILIDECVSLLQKGKLSPENFNLFVSNMIDVLGGKRFNEDAEASIELPDKKKSQTISLVRARAGGLDFGLIEFGPVWFDRFAYNLGKTVNETGIPAIFRTVTFGFSSFHNLLGPYPSETVAACLPNKGESLEAVMPPHMQIYHNTLVSPHTRITNKRLREICREVFGVYKNQDAAVAA